MAWIGEICKVSDASHLLSNTIIFHDYWCVHFREDFSLTSSVMRILIRDILSVEVDLDFANALLINYDLNILC